MPLLMCPNDNAPMQTLDRNGVQFDMCPSCRGVWLDRGELEKLMESATSEGRASAQVAAPIQNIPPQAPQPHHQQPSPWNQHPQQAPYRSRDDDYRRHKEDERYYKKKKRLDIFDIFD